MSRILLIETFYSGSHQAWADNVQQIFGSNMDCISLPGKYWKWRMEGGAWKAAEEYKKKKDRYDIILCSSLFNLPLFLSLAEVDRSTTRIYMYMHENQINYPWPEGDEDVKNGRDRHYGFINLMNTIVADKIIFNSHYHRRSFLDALGPFVKPFPDVKVALDLDEINAKSSVLGIPLKLNHLIKEKKQSPENSQTQPIILWNHRWEYDKNPELFFHTLMALKQKNMDFSLIVLGEKYRRYPQIFDTAQRALADRIIHFGYLDDPEEYDDMILKADILPVCSIHDFFGISVVQGIAAGCIPLLPNRLAYPEHLDPIKYPDLFYDSTDTFEQKLSNLLKKESHEDLREEMKKYDIDSLSEPYRTLIK